MNTDQDLQQVFMDLFLVPGINTSFPARFWAELKETSAIRTCYINPDAAKCLV